MWSLELRYYIIWIISNKYIFGSNLKETEINRQKGKIINKTDDELINNLINKLIKVNIEERIKWEEYFNDDFLFLIMNLIMNMNKL